MTPTYRISALNNYISITSDDLDDFEGLTAPSKEVRIVTLPDDDQVFEFWNLDGRNTMWNRLKLNQILDGNGDPFTLLDWTVFYTANTSQYGISATSSGGATEVTLSSINSKTPSLGQASMTGSSPVVIASNQSAIPVTQSGSFTVNPGNTQNTTPWLTIMNTPAVTTTFDTGAKTISGNGGNINNFVSKGATILFNIGTVTGTLPTCVFKIQGSSDSGTTWYDIPNANTATITASGTYGIQIYPGVAPVAGTTVSGTIAQVNSVLPRNWRVVWTIGGTTPSFTITNIQVAYII